MSTIELLENPSKVPLAQSVNGGPTSPFIFQFTLLTQRFWRNSYRDHLVLGVRIFLAIFMGFVVGTVFFQLGYSQVDADERVSAIFVTLLYLMFTGNMFLPEIFSARPMYFRETTSDSYSASAFYLARFVADIPWVLIECTILAIMIYWICNFHPTDEGPHWVRWWITLIGVRWTSIAATWFIGTTIENPNNANTIHATYFNLLFAFTGFLIPRPYVPEGWIWFVDLNYLQYALQYLVHNEMEGEQFHCSPTELIRVASTYGSCPLPSTTPISGTTIEKCYYQCGTDLMQNFGVSLTNSDQQRNLGVLFAFFIFFFLLGFLSLKYINHIHR